MVELAQMAQQTQKRLSKTLKDKARKQRRLLTRAQKEHKVLLGLGNPYKLCSVTITDNSKH